MNRYGQDWDKRRIKTWMWQETCSPGEKEESNLHQCFSGDQEDDWWVEEEKGQGWTGGGWIDPSAFWGWKIIANFVTDPLFFPEQGICIKIWQEPGVCDQALIFLQFLSHSSIFFDANSIIFCQFICMLHILLYLCTYIQTKIGNFMTKVSLRQRVLEMKIGERIVVPVKEHAYTTIRSYASDLGFATGRTYSTTRNREERTYTIIRRS